MSTYHVPVLAQQSVEAWMDKPDGIYVDATFGGGGHSRLLMKKLGPQGRLIAFDQDPDAIANRIEDERFTLVEANFRHLERFVRLHAQQQVDGILADLGVSSHQFDTAERGFSYRFEGELDMRMDTRHGMTAAELLEKSSAAELQSIFSRYGEVRNAKTLAHAIKDAEAGQQIKRIEDLLRVVEPYIRGNKPRYLAQVFQALRIAVNEEMEVLDSFLAQCENVLKPGGNLVVITYHSIEDRLVKSRLKTGTRDGQPLRDYYGNIYRPFKGGNKVILPDAEEIKKNSRARSAKLRIGTRTAEQPPEEEM